MPQRIAGLLPFAKAPEVPDLLHLIDTNWYAHRRAAATLLRLQVVDPALTFKHAFGAGSVVPSAAKATTFRTPMTA
jgi:hypothetical protein